MADDVGSRRAEVRRVVKKLRPRTMLARVRRPRTLYLLSGTTEPLSRTFGLDRGSAIDRFHIDGFLQRHRLDVRGRCLEVASDRYTVTLGDDRVTRRDVLDIDPANRDATIVGDLRALDGVGDASFDCVILTQTLQYVDDLPAAIAHLWRVLAPGGVLLVTVPSVLPIDPFVPPESDYWRFTTASVRYLLTQRFRAEDVDVSSWGNAREGMALWAGMAQEDLNRAALRHADPQHPCGVVARAVKR